MLDWKTLPSLSSLRAFEAVAREGSFSGAARALNVTHAAISQQVRGLEAELGVLLARRAGRQVALTEAGRTLALGLSEGFSAVARAVEVVKAREAARALRVTTTPFIVDAIIMPRLSEFWQRHPGVEIALQPDVRIVDLVAEGFDLGIRASSAGASWPGLDAVELAESQWVAVGAPALIKDETDPLALPWVWTDRMPSEIAALKTAGVNIDGLEKADVGSDMLHWQATRRGLGMSLASEHVAREDIAAGRLVELDLPGLPTDGRYYAVSPKVGVRRPIVGHFVDWLQAIF